MVSHEKIRDSIQVLIAFIDVSSKLTCYAVSMNCSSELATPAHILECLGLTKQDLADVSLLVLDFLKVMPSGKRTAINPTRPTPAPELS
ncbi:hypothetical protein TNCV_1929601 [Trichonephila clavipes]|nr:hypothetical protein TNCV_1929601 [Trichonephila clavipes]